MNSSKKTVVITGATSFVGMHLCEKFSDNGWQVIASHSQNLAEYTALQSSRISHISNKVEFEQFNINDDDALSNIVNEYAPTLWIQHAGYATNYASAEFEFEKGLTLNVGSVPKLFRILKDKNCGVIITGTEAEYGPSEKAHAESDMPQPNSLYGVSKLTQTITAQQQSDYYDVPTRVARLFLPFGSLDNPGKLISLVVEALKNSKPIDLSPCTQKRDLIGIKDVCKAYLKIADDIDRGGFDIFNVCSGEATELRELLKLIATTLETNHQLLNFGSIPLHEGEPNIVLGNPNKAFSQLNLEPHPLDQVVRTEFLNT